MEAIRVPTPGVPADRAPAPLREPPFAPQRPRHRALVNPRVLRVMTRLNVGGPSRQAIFLTRELKERGFDTRLVWGASGPREGTVDPGPGVAATSMPWLARDLRPA